MTVQGPVKEQQPDGMSHGGDLVGGYVRGQFASFNSRKVAKFRGVGSVVQRFPTVAKISPYDPPPL